MIYFNSSPMIKIHPRMFLSAVLIAIGIALGLTASSFITASTQATGTAVASLTMTPTASAAGMSSPGSTDWIALMGVIIVLIVVLPVLFRRSTWTK